MSGVFYSAFANLGNEKLSKGGIIAIIIPILLILIASLFLAIYCFRKKRLFLQIKEILLLFLIILLLLLIKLFKYEIKIIIERNFPRIISCIKSEEFDKLNFDILVICCFKF